ncbi:phosphotransferase [Sinorhizobium sp. BG8]|uniref:phosphotransferase n=1 Tax=Sinorhizobium sp. BG8 TaxID=2613773 RepID=UPI00193D59D8|nr:phosphotransferase [Sinorhizobium sp. BG8]QRM56530.1 phosphotransferase [Sinorhizobium sp. BG8]
MWDVLDSDVGLEELAVWQRCQTGTKVEGGSEALAREKIQSLPIWKGDVAVSPVAGGMTNRNYLVSDGRGQYFVRIGEDIPVHHISRANELAASRAAHAAGLSPALVHHAPGILVFEYIAARTLGPEDVRNPFYLERIVTLLRRCHQEVGRHFRGAAAFFWVFHVVEDYAATLTEAGSPHVPLLADLLGKARLLEKAASPYDIVFGHNDLLAANFLDDGNRLWLVDWDYAGYNSPLFDLGGLASNNELSEAQERWLLEAYFDTSVSDSFMRRYRAMKCASLLRETMWSMVSELYSAIDFDYAAYTADNLSRFHRSYDDFREA